MCAFPRPSCSTCAWRCTGICSRSRRASGRGRKLGDVVSRINNDIAEVQRVSADSLLSVLSNVVFLIGSAAIMAPLSPRLFLLSAAVIPISLWTLKHYQRRLSDRVRAGPRAQRRYRQLPAGNAARHPAGGVLPRRSARGATFPTRQPEFRRRPAAHAVDRVSLGRGPRHPAHAFAPRSCSCTAANW